MLVVDVPWIIPAALYASYFNILAHILYCLIPAKTILFRLMTPANYSNVILTHDVHVRTFRRHRLSAV
jgi:hypothetical protein